MEFIAELLVELVFALALILISWCVSHKNITFAILAVLLVIVDIFVLMKLVIGS